VSAVVAVLAMGALGAFLALRGNAAAHG
jgi:hypothetical protein